MLEDDFNDCLSKAIRGHGCTIAQLALLAGINEGRITACINGQEDAAVIHMLAPHLQLNADNLLQLKEYDPQTHRIPGLTQVTSPFGHLGVNAYIVHSSKGALIFDTGTDSSKLHVLAPSPAHLFITHNHPDHTAGVIEFAHCQKSFPEELSHGDNMQFGKLYIKILDVTGHYNPARAFFIQGLERPICIVGDSIFAGSIGKCMSTESYSTALANIRDHVLKLPNETILCPGHGPLTTVGLEKDNNPFF
ncbi:MAG: MBL fold metallo-hydrolase [Rubritalea sp.]|uniref:MBL fold metallo-hydrolase n=1 Tax=Rubritalea sp. TaxID=2109375 RepID=UPI0032420726